MRAGGSDVAPTPIVNFRLPPALLERIDGARGEESRTGWLVRAIEHELDGPAAVASARPTPRVSSADAKAGVLPR